MTDRVVLDVSVAVALLAEEVGSEAARRLASRWEASRAELVVPSHFWLELTNVLVHRKGRAANDAIEGLVVIEGLAPRTIELDRPTPLLALEAMDRYGVSAYDAAYVALAQAMDARLATLDGRLAAVALELGVSVEPADDRLRLAEQPARYANAPAASGWLRSAAVGRYIAELRREAAGTPSTG